MKFVRKHSDLLDFVEKEEAVCGINNTKKRRGSDANYVLPHDNGTSMYEKDFNVMQERLPTNNSKLSFSNTINNPKVGYNQHSSGECFCN